MRLFVMAGLDPAFQLFHAEARRTRSGQLLRVSASPRAPLPFWTADPLSDSVRGPRQDEAGKDT